MGKFYCIARGKTSPTTVKLLREACQKRGLTFVLVNSQDYDFSRPHILGRGDMLYKTSTDERSTMVFKTLLQRDVATVFKSFKAALSAVDNVALGPLLHQKHSLPIIKTIFDLPRNKTILKSYAKELGGFPIIIKATGGSHGVGVMKIDSLESLYSVADYLITHKTKGQLFILRQYIDDVASARLIVLEGKVVDSLNYKRVKDDFRSNAGVGDEIQAEQKTFSKSVQEAAVAAVELSGADFGGVDILIDKKSKSHIAEVNTPCFFPRAQLITGADIAGKIVDSLKKKAENIR